MNRPHLLPVLLCILLSGCGMRPQPQEPPVPRNIVATLAVCGDVMSHMPLTNDAYDGQTDTYDYTPLFQDIKPYLSKADYAVANLETTFSGGPDYTGYPAFNTPDALGAALADAGFDLLSTANNHCMDYGNAGQKRTLDVLDAQGLAHIGTYRSAQERSEKQDGVYFADIGGITVAFLSYTYGTNGIPVQNADTVNLLYTDYLGDAQSLNLPLLMRDLDTAKSHNPDLIAVMVHWGTEYETIPNDVQKQTADALLSLGADLILGGHPHVLQPIETRTVKLADGQSHTGVVVWSLGNFISTQRIQYTDTTVLLTLELTKNQDTTTITKIDYVPLLMVDRGKGVHGRRYALMDANKELHATNHGKQLIEKLTQCISDCDQLLGFPRTILS